MTHQLTAALIVAGVLPVILVACAAPAPDSPPVTAAAVSPSARATPTAAEPYAARPMAFINGETITAADLHAPLIEAAGGQALAELVIDRVLRDRLAEAGLTLTPEQLDAERQLLISTFDAADDDEAARVLRELRRRRGLGEQRFTSLLRRNAAMRALVRQQVNVDEQALRRAYELAYGEQYVARIIVVPTLQEAARLREMLRDPEASFADLAVKRSSDPSAVQGGLLPPISPADDEVAKVIRDTLVRLDERGERVSDPVSVPSGYALVSLERKEAAESVEFADVRDRLAETVRRSAERVLMQQLARELLAAANVVVLDPALANGWTQQKDAMLGN